MNIIEMSAFGIYLAGMLAIGIYSYYKTNDMSDYVLGGRNLGSGVAALSAGASDMSGWLLLGLPGAIFLGGMSQVWIGVGLVIGAFLNWHLIAARLRKYTEVAGDALTIPDYFENRFHDRSRILRLISATVILLFFCFYIASGLVGGAVLFEKTFGLDYTLALWVGAFVIVSYTFLGGFLAVCWTDMIQGILMLIALTLVPIIAIQYEGGYSSTVEQVRNISPNAMNLFHGLSLLQIISLLAWGLGYFGQPHILARFMGINSVKSVRKAKYIGMSWMSLALIGSIAVGLAGIPFFGKEGLENSESVFIIFTQKLFTPWIAGFLLAAILAAIMSTVDSQLLVVSSVIAEDFYKTWLRPKATNFELVWLGRIAVVLVALVALFIASDPKAKVLELVSYAWAGFGSSFGPVVILSVFWKKMNKYGAMSGLIVGSIVTVVWKELDGGIFDMYEMIPGFIAGMLSVYVGTILTEEPSRVIQKEFVNAQI